MLNRKNKNNLKESRKKRQKHRLSAIFAKFLPTKKNGNDRNKSAPKNSRNTRELAEGRGKPDLQILFICIGLTLFGWIMVYSGSFYVASQRKDTLFFENNPFHFFILQGIWIVLGAIGGYILYRIDLNLLKKLSLPLILAVIGLLIFVLIQPLSVNGAKLWIFIGSFSLQPSELARLAIVIYLAAVFSKKWYKDDPKLGLASRVIERLMPIILVALPVTLLVFLGPDLAVAGLVLIISLVMFFFADRGKLHNAIVAGQIFLAGIASLVLAFSANYRASRVNTFLDFLRTGEVQDKLGSGYQLNQILIAVGSGGLFGYGFGQSRQKYFYLQDTAFSDTIFAVVAEEFGFFGSIILVAVFAILFLRLLKLAGKTKNKFASMLVVGITAWLSVQTLIHLAVNVGLMPLTGITLPLMSYGGSSLIVSLTAVGLLLNISRDVKLE